MGNQLEKEINFENQNFCEGVKNKSPVYLILRPTNKVSAYKRKSWS